MPDGEKPKQNRDSLNVETERPDILWDIAKGHNGIHNKQILGGAIRLIHEFSITGSIARQPLLMADQACKCWFFFISNKFNGLIFKMEYDI